MKNPFEHPGETPITFLIAIAYVTIAALTRLPWPEQNLLFAYGMLRPLDVVFGDWWRLIAHAFVHGGLVHLGFNAMALAMFGPMLERSLGSLKFAILYLVAAVGGGIAVCLYCDFLQPVVGGSGALFGMMGAAVAINMRSGRHLLSFLDFEGPRALMGLIFFNLLLSWLIPYVSNTAHIGGLISGFLVTFFFLLPARERLGGHDLALRAGVAVLYLSCLLYSLFPTARTDYLLLRWHDTPTESMRDDLRRACTLARLHIPQVVFDEDEMRHLYNSLVTMRRRYEER